MGIKRIVAELDAEEPVGCPKCWKGQAKEVIKPTFTYRGSSLGPFEVKNARLYECPSCKNVWYDRSEARYWEVGKALDLIAHTRLLRGNQFRFLRQVLGKTIEDLASGLGVDKSTVSRWEQGRITEQASKEVSRYFALHALTNYLWARQAKGDQSVMPFLRHMSENLEIGIDRARTIAKALEAIEA